jgi:NADH:ubiquinone reductase (H+-translocating)
MRVPGYANLWALGDCAMVPNAYDGTPSPTLAQFALRQAKQLAANVRRVETGRPTRPFSFRMLGSFAAIGHHNAVGEVLGLRFSGLLAWFMWRAIYLGKMPTLARKVQVAFDWAWDLLFPRDIVQLSKRETERVPRAHFEPGEYVFRQGDPADKFYIVERGKAGVYLDDWPEPVASLGPGDYFGERALFRPGNRMTSIRAEEPLDVLSILRGPLEDLMNHLSLLRTGLEENLERVESVWQFRSVVRDHPRLNVLRVQEAMAGPVQTLPAGMTYAAAIAQFQREGRGARVIVDEMGHLQGICTTGDLQNALCHLKPLTTPVTEIMSRPVLTIGESKSLAQAMDIFLREPIAQLVVVADDDATCPVGLLTPFDILLHYTTTSPVDGLAQQESPQRNDTGSDHYDEHAP